MKKIFYSLLIGVMVLGCGCGVSQDEYDKLEKENITLQEENEKLSSELDKQKSTSKSYKEAEEKIKEQCSEYLSLNDDEKELVDGKIVEVKQATADQLAAEKAQKEAEEAAKKKAEEEAKKAEEERIAAEKAAEEQARKEAEAHKYETGLTWEQIAREGKVGTLGQFEGKIIQVMNGNGYTQYRVAINGNYDTIMLVEIDDTVKTETLLEDDYIYFKGTSAGTMTYTTVMGAEMTIPAFECHEITR